MSDHPGLWCIPFNSNKKHWALYTYLLQYLGSGTECPMSILDLNVQNNSHCCSPRACVRTCGHLQLTALSIFTIVSNRIIIVVSVPRPTMTGRNDGKYGRDYPFWSLPYTTYLQPTYYILSLTHTWTENLIFRLFKNIYNYIIYIFNVQRVQNVFKKLSSPVWKVAIRYPSPLKSK